MKEIHNKMVSSSGGFCYSADVSPNPNNNNQSQFAATNNQIQDFHDQIFNTNTNNNNNNNNQSLVSDWQENNNNQNNNLIFSCEGNERPSHGLSLTLSSNNPSAIGLQTFELRHTTAMTHHHHHNHHESTSQQQYFQLRNSKFLIPAQELLNEFCSLGTRSSSDNNNNSQMKQKSRHKWGFDNQESNNIIMNNNNNNNGASSSSSKKSHSLYSLEFLELQKRKTKLLSMLEEVERRYKKYCEQMRGVTSSFEAAAGPGSAEVYSALASKAMSRHFRCLKDGIAGQIEATRRAMGEGDDVAGVPGTTRGETPRLRAIDQAVRQQRAFQQMSVMESHPWRPQRGLPERSVSVLRAWLFEHFLHPYPSDVDKHILARQTGLSRSQVSNWFINARVRLWKPMVEEMYIEETKEAQSSNHHHHNQANMINNNMTNSSSEPGENNMMGFVDPTSRPDHHDQKPGPDQLVRIGSESLSSVVSDKTETPAQHITHVPNMQIQQNFGYNAISELDFSSYSPQTQFPGTGVSLTLGLQQHAGAVSHSHHHGVSLAFSPGSQSSMFYPRSSSDNHHHHQNSGGSNMDDQVPAVQYSLLDGDQGQNLPYRNLMGAQLLHDLA